MHVLPGQHTDIALEVLTLKVIDHFFASHLELHRINAIGCFDIQVCAAGRLDDGLATFAGQFIKVRVLLEPLHLQRTLQPVERHKDDVAVDLVVAGLKLVHCRDAQLDRIDRLTIGREDRQGQLDRVQLIGHGDRCVGNAAMKRVRAIFQTVLVRVDRDADNRRRTVCGHLESRKTFGRSQRFARGLQVVDRLHFLC